MTRWCVLAMALAGHSIVLADSKPDRRHLEGGFLAADGGWAALLDTTRPVATTSTRVDRDAWTFGLGAGYQLRSGLAVQTRFDQLGVTAPGGGGHVSIWAGGLRYAIPALARPFVEAMVGTALHDSTAAFGASLGVGISLVAARHFVFDFVLRDSIVDIEGIHHIASFTFGICAGFGG